MGLTDLFKRGEDLLSIDIGASGVKVIELERAGSKPRLLNVGVAPLAGEVFSGNAIAKPDRVAEQISFLIESNEIDPKRVATAVPAPSVFTKRIKMPRVGLSELSANVRLEAGNFIPHNVDQVRLDFHVLGESGKNQLDVLVAAVKNEVTDSYLDCMAMAGLEVAVLDVDFFALQNVFEINYPELVDDTVAIINVGARYSSINICRGGNPVFTGDISVGGKLFTEAISQELGVSVEEAELLKRKPEKDKDQSDRVRDILDRNLEYAAGEFNRSLSFYWNAAGSSEAIARILMTGGGSVVEGLVDELAEKTGLVCELLDPLREIDLGDSFDEEYVKDVAPLIGIGVGMGIREPGDREVPDFI